MAIETHIKFDNIQGESTSKDHKDEIEVLSWQWGLSSPRQAGGGGGSAGRATPQDFTFTHVYDRASPILAALAATGRVVKQAWLSARNAGTQKDFLKVTMNDVVITGVQQSGSSESIEEVVSASAGRIHFEYKPMDSKGGFGAAVKFDWDIVKNTVK